MKPRKTLSGTIRQLGATPIHVLLPEEDGVLVARCLDFSVSSHGENKQNALTSLSDSILDYLDYAIEHNALNDILDPEDEQYWRMFAGFRQQTSLNASEPHLFP
jgi:hypothetical protein